MYNSAPPGNNAGYSNLTLNNNGTQASGSDVRLINESRPSMDQNPNVPKEYTKFTKYSTLLVLFCINLLNYMDRFTIISVLSAVRTAFDINNKQAALLNMVFLISYMILSPIVGYLGKRRFVLKCTENEFRRSIQSKIYNNCWPLLLDIDCDAIELHRGTSRQLQPFSGHSSSRWCGRSILLLSGSDR